MLATPLPDARVAQPRCLAVPGGGHVVRKESQDVAAHGQEARVWQAGKPFCWAEVFVIRSCNTNYKYSWVLGPQVPSLSVCGAQVVPNRCFPLSLFPTSPFPLELLAGADAGGEGIGARCNKSSQLKRLATCYSLQATSYLGTRH